MEPNTASSYQAIVCTICFSKSYSRALFRQKFCLCHIQYSTFSDKSVVKVLYISHFTYSIVRVLCKNCDKSLSYESSLHPQSFFNDCFDAYRILGAHPWQGDWRRAGTRSLG